MPGDVKPCPSSWTEWRKWISDVEDRLRRLTRYEETSTHLDGIARQLEEWTAPRRAPAVTREEVARVIRGKMAWGSVADTEEAADAILALLNGESGA